MKASRSNPAQGGRTIFGDHCTDQPSVDHLLCTKQVARLTGLSPSYFEKGRTYQYGPAYIRLGRAIRYRQADVQKWMNANHHENGGTA